MASRLWKKIEQSNPVRKAKLAVKQFLKIEPKYFVDIDIPILHLGGWDFPPSLLNPSDTVYSFGVCDDIEFERQLIEQFSVNIFAFDPTPFSIDWLANNTLPEYFFHYPWAGSGTNADLTLYPRTSRKGKLSKTMFTVVENSRSVGQSISVPAKTVRNIIDRLGHQKIDVIKLDVEGAEYGILETMINDAILPKIVLVEFHHRFSGIGAKKTHDIIAILKREGYLIAAISATAREYCFVNSKLLPNHTADRKISFN